MNLLIKEFNETVGREKGIRIQVTNVTSTSKIQAQLLDAQAGKPGAPELPDLFSCHTQNAQAFGIENLLDWSQWFAENELDNYVPEFIESGVIEEKLVVFPVSKSTYALFVNGSQFARFSADTGVTYESLSDWDSFFAAAEKYYEWSGGSAFCALDYLIRHMELDILSRYGKLEYTENGWYDENDSAIKESFSTFAEALVKGHIVVSDLYANTQVMTGEVLSGIGSSAAVGSLFMSGPPYVYVYTHAHVLCVCSEYRLGDGLGALIRGLVEVVGIDERGLKVGVSCELFDFLQRPPGQ